MSLATKKSVAPGAPITPFRNDDGFMVEEDGLVDMRLELTFVEDVKVRVTPEVAKRVMDGEFDNQDPGDIPGLDMDEVMNTTRVEVESAYEGRPPRPEPGAVAVDDEDDLI